MRRLIEIRSQVIKDLTSTRVIQDLLAGKLDRNLYIRYLINAASYAQYSAKVMALAAARCMDSHPSLADYLLHHAAEEQGHDRWALADLSDLGMHEATARETR